MMRSLRGALSGVAASLLAMSCASTGAPEPTVTDGTASPSVRAPGKPAPALRLGVTALSRDERGVPRMLRAVDSVKAPAGSTAEAAARFHLGRIGAAWFDGGKPADLDLVAVHKIRGGASIVRLAQRIEGNEVFGGELRVLVNADGSLHMVSGERYATAATTGSFTKSASSASSTALRAHYGVEIAANAFAVHKALGGYDKLVAPPRTDVAINALRSKRVWLPVDGELKAANFVEFMGNQGGPTGTMHYFVAADSDEVLKKVSRTFNEANTYRVFADNDAEGRPFDGPLADFSPHPTGTPNGQYPAARGSNLITVEGRNHPAGATTSDPWLPQGATSLIGNHVEVYSDRNGDNTPDAPDIRATASGTNRYDYTYDQALEPLASDTQVRAGLTQLFYTINWLHDYWYDRGFTETAGNAQRSNLGRGGLEGDAIHAQGQDGAISYPANDPEGPGPRRGNANMQTPSDGLTPVMQMFLWSDNVAQVTLTPGGTTRAGSSQFGPTLFDLTQPVALVDDGNAADGGSTSDGCQTIGGNVAGKIALVDRGSCNFSVKVKNAQTAGALGVIIANNNAIDGPVQAAGDDATVTIPSLGVSQALGTQIKDALGRGAVSARLQSQALTERDGTLDNTVVAHEWGHYFHLRLAECNGTLQCGAMGEGWGDFVAMHLIVRPTDNFDGTYALAIYDTHEDPSDAGYFGIRRYPYSTNLARNPLTFKHIGNSNALPTDVPGRGLGVEHAEVHAAGEVWAQMLWESYRALIARHGYAEARTRMADYVVAGLLLHPADASYTEARDAVLEAASKGDIEDMKVMAQAFAKRGAGTCAVSPPSESMTFDEVVESGDVKARFESGDVEIIDDVASCDKDGYLDPGETGTIKVKLLNKGAVTATGVTVSATSSVAGVTVEPVTVANLAPFAVTDVAFRVTVADTATPGSKLDLSITVSSADACGDYVIPFSPSLGVDEQPGASANDDFQASKSPWKPTGLEAWGFGDAGDGERVVHGNELVVAGSTELESPDLVVGGNDLQVTLKHRYAFETVAGFGNFDGGVIEVSTDGGSTWKDVAELGADPKYGAALLREVPEFDYVSTNPLAGRAAYGALSTGAPDFATVTFNLKKKLAGKTAKMRFRIGTDEGGTAYGWDIADLKFEGLRNLPFTAILDEGGNCKAGVGVDAGPEHTVYGGTTATLLGTTSVESPQVAWTVVSGDVTLKDADKLTASFDAPEVDEDKQVTLRLTVNNGPAGAISDDVVITISPPPADDDDDGCGCRTTSPAGTAGMLLPLAALAFAMRRRRAR